MKDNAKKWVKQSVNYFKGMGFFQNGFNLEKIHEYVRDVYFDEYLERQPKPHGWGALDWLLLSQDTKRVSSVGDQIINVNDTSKDYIDAINHWGVISNGVFTPINIDFQWIKKFDIFSINLDFKDKHLTFRSDSRSRIDDELLFMINGLMEGTECLFYECNAEGIESQVIALTEYEKEKLTKERGWHCHLGIQ
ncbi:MAG: hypothetical protein IPO36_10410 [Anaerolineales bacterium]|nr:hypothetical protein [Anaerolineales bacterium]